MKKKLKLILRPILRPWIHLIRKVHLVTKLFISCKIKNYNSQSVILMATPCHGNLGDHAIVYAEYMFLKNRGLAKNIVEISNINYIMFKKQIQRIVKDDDIIIIDGGGNLGTLWPNEDDKISEIIESYPNNKIIVFPQTCFYSKDSGGYKRLLRNKKIYTNHNNLTITLRDKQSFLFFQKEFSEVESIFVPDIVLYINKFYKSSGRDGVMLCLRHDLERIISDSEVSYLTSFLENSNLKYFHSDTVVSYYVNMHKRTKELYKKWAEFSSASLVITDRLHGMLFAVITGTPCIAIDNKSKKVSGVCDEWLPELNNIIFCENMTQACEHINDIYNCLEVWNNDSFKNKFEAINLSDVERINENSK